MAISEKTKQVAAQVKRELNARIDFLQRTRDEHLRDIASIDSEISNLKAQRDALVIDIPEPTAVVQGE